MRAVLASIAAGLCATSLAFSHQPSQGTETAEWVARQIDQRNTAKDARLDMTMRLFDRHGRPRERTLVITSLRRTTGDRVLVRFLAPGDIKGTGLLVWEHPAGEDERFLYLPALGRVRRIAGSEKQESFVGSDLTYEDIGSRKVEDYTYAFVQRETMWTGPDDRPYPAWQLESTAKDTQANYPRTVSIVRKDNFVVVEADIFNRRNEREKHYLVRRLERVDGVWTAMDVVMTNAVLGTRTALVVTAAKYNIGFTEADFTRRVLEQKP